MNPRSNGGFTVLELLIAVAIASVLVTVAYTTWQKYSNQQRLRFSVIQVASGLREAEERAKAERKIYTVTFTASSSTYGIQRSGGGFVENAPLPPGVTPQATDTVTFNAFGVPDAAHTITLQNSTGTKTASVDAAGGITYQAP